MMTLTRYGFREWGSGLVIWLLLLAGCYGLTLIRCSEGGIAVLKIAAWVIGVLSTLAFLYLCFFFRNPPRTIPSDLKALVSPADGVVRDIGVVEDFNFPPFNGKALRIGIFLSVFNVHVNRAPAAWKIVSKYYREGEYLDARNPECARRNEAMTLAGTATAAGAEFPMAVRQISGAIARRIVCPVEPGRELAKGEIYGMIKFGSRTELYLPVDGFEVAVKIGDRVYGGETVMVRRRTENEVK